MPRKNISKADEEAKAKNEALDAKLSKMESELKCDTVGQIRALDHSIRSYLDTKIELFFKQISDQIGNLINAKYSDIHNRDNTNINPNSVTKEHVRLTVERVITKQYIATNVQYYMQELSLIRFILLLIYYILYE
jgi:hypothetical protein